MISPVAGRATAAQTLTATATVTRPGVDTFTSGTGVVEATPIDVWSGPCSISPPSGLGGQRTATGGDDRSVDVRTVRIPTPGSGLGSCCATVETGDADDITPGDHLAIEGDPETYVVRVNQRRTTEVLRRLQVVSLADAQGVPR